MKKIMGIIGVLLCMFVLVACQPNEEKGNGKKKEVITLVSRPLATQLFFSGVVQPLKTVVVTSPADGVIQEVLFHYGETVGTDKLLFMISSEKFQTEYKNTLMQYIKSKNEFDTIYSQLTQSKFLHKNQLISDDEFKAKQSAFYNAQLSSVQAREALNTMLKQLTVQGFKIEELTIEHIEKITQALHAQGDTQRLRAIAPVPGVVLLPGKSEGEGEVKKIGKGDQVKQGDVLAVIGNTDGLTIRVSVNEFNISQLKTGQKVKVSIAAYPDLLLQGRISGIDRQAQSSAGGMPMFPIEVVVPTLTPKEKKLIHMGMSAKVEINIEGEPQIAIPIAAILEKNGQTYVTTQDAKTGKTNQVQVKTSQATTDLVVVESGLKVGDKLVIIG